MTIEKIEIVFNGINGETGDYLQPPLTHEQIVKIAASQENSSILEEIEKKSQDKDKNHLRPMSGVDQKNLTQTGWGVIFAHVDLDLNVTAIEKKLTKLLEHRKQQAKDYYREYEYYLDDSKDGHLKERSVENGSIVHRVGNTNVVDPQKMPYYLLIVGDPKIIPYSFQYQLDVAYAVGRIYFEELKDYESYACNVVKSETGEISRPRPPLRAVFFGVHHERDEPTKKSAEQLISPLYEWVKKDEKIKEKGWNVQIFPKDQAKKEQLKKLLGGSETPDFLFTASHGVGFNKGHPLQRSDQGALLCQDWPGLKTPLEKKFYFSADDVGDDAQLHGLISFHFACHSVGTSDIDSFHFASHSVGTSDINSSNLLSNNKSIAPEPFVARLPQRLLSRGALAVFGHVEQVLESSFVEKGIDQLENFQDTLRRLMDGEPVGFAVESFNEHYSKLACGLWEKIQDPLGDPEDASQSWLSFRNARSYAIVGDPAVRLAVEDAPKIEQPLKETVQSPIPPISELPANTQTAIASNGVLDESDLRQAEHQLTQALEKFLNVVEQAQADQLQQQQSTIDAVKNQLNEAIKTLESLKLKQAQFQFIQAIEEFISTAAQAEHLQPTVKAAKELLKTLKQLS